MRNGAKASVLAVGVFHTINVQFGSGISWLGVGKATKTYATPISSPVTIRMSSFATSKENAPTLQLGSIDVLSNVQVVNNAGGSPANGNIVIAPLPTQLQLQTNGIDMAVPNPITFVKRNPQGRIIYPHHNQTDTLLHTASLGNTIELRQPFVPLPTSSSSLTPSSSSSSSSPSLASPIITEEFFDVAPNVFYTDAITLTPLTWSVNIPVQTHLHINIPQADRGVTVAGGDTTFTVDGSVTVDGQRSRLTVQSNTVVFKSTSIITTTTCSALRIESSTSSTAHVREVGGRFLQSVYPGDCGSISFFSGLEISRNAAVTFTSTFTQGDFLSLGVGGALTIKVSGVVIDKVICTGQVTLSDNSMLTIGMLKIDTSVGSGLDARFNLPATSSLYIKNYEPNAGSSVYMTGTSAGVNVPKVVVGDGFKFQENMYFLGAGRLLIGEDDEPSRPGNFKGRSFVGVNTAFYKQASYSALLSMEAAWTMEISTQSSLQTQRDAPIAPRIVKRDESSAASFKLIVRGILRALSKSTLQVVSEDVVFTPSSIFADHRCATLTFGAKTPSRRAKITIHGRLLHFTSPDDQSPSEPFDPLTECTGSLATNSALTFSQYVDVTLYPSFNFPANASEPFAMVYVTDNALVNFVSTSPPQDGDPIPALQTLRLTSSSPVVDIQTPLRVQNLFSTGLSSSIRLTGPTGRLHLVNSQSTDSPISLIGTNVAGNQLILENSGKTSALFRLFGQGAVRVAEGATVHADTSVVSSSSPSAIFELTSNTQTYPNNVWSYDLPSTSTLIVSGTKKVALTRLTVSLRGKVIIHSPTTFALDTRNLETTESTDITYYDCAALRFGDPSTPETTPSPIRRLSGNLTYISSRSESGELYPPAPTNCGADDAGLVIADSAIVSLERDLTIRSKRTISLITLTDRSSLYVHTFVYTHKVSTGSTKVHIVGDGVLITDVVSTSQQATPEFIISDIGQTKQVSLSRTRLTLNVGSIPIGYGPMLTFKNVENQGIITVTGNYTQYDPSTEWDESFFPLTGADWGLGNGTKIVTGERKGVRNGWIEGPLFNLGPGELRDKSNANSIIWKGRGTVQIGSSSRKVVGPPPQTLSTGANTATTTSGSSLSSSSTSLSLNTSGLTASLTFTPDPEIERIVNPRGVFNIQRSTSFDFKTNGPVATSGWTMYIPEGAMLKVQAPSLSFYTVSLSMNGGLHVFGGIYLGPKDTTLQLTAEYVDFTMSSSIYTYLCTTVGIKTNPKPSSARGIVPDERPPSVIFSGEIKNGLIRPRSEDSCGSSSQDSNGFYLRVPITSAAWMSPHFHHKTAITDEMGQPIALADTTSLPRFVVGASTSDYKDTELTVINNLVSFNEIYLVGSVRLGLPDASPVTQSLAYPNVVIFAGSITYQSTSPFGAQAFIQGGTAAASVSVGSYRRSGSSRPLSFIGMPSNATSTISHGVAGGLFVTLTGGEFGNDLLFRGVGSLRHSSLSGPEAQAKLTIYDDTTLTFSLGSSWNISRSIGSSIHVYERKDLRITGDCNAHQWSGTTTIEHRGALTITCSTINVDHSHELILKDCGQMLFSLPPYDIWQSTYKQQNRTFGGTISTVKSSISSHDECSPLSTTSTFGLVVDAPYQWVSSKSQLSLLPSVVTTAPLSRLHVGEYGNVDIRNQADIHINYLALSGTLRVDEATVVASTLFPYLENHLLLLSSDRCLVDIVTTPTTSDTLFPLRIQGVGGHSGSTNSSLRFSSIGSLGSSTTPPSISPSSSVSNENKYHFGSRVRFQNASRNVVLIGGGSIHLDDSFNPQVSDLSFTFNPFLSFDIPSIFSAPSSSPSSSSTPVSLNPVDTASWVLHISPGVSTLFNKPVKFVKIGAVIEGTITINTEVNIGGAVDIAPSAHVTIARQRSLVLGSNTFESNSLQGDFQLDGAINVIGPATLLNLTSAKFAGTGTLTCVSISPGGRTTLNRTLPVENILTYYDDVCRGAMITSCVYPTPVISYSLEEPQYQYIAPVNCTNIDRGDARFELLGPEGNKLPNGLFFNETDGAIYGTAQRVWQMQVHTVVPYNARGEGESFNFTLQVASWNCPGGYFCPSKGERQRCQAGFECPPNSIAQKPCQLGTYCPPETVYAKKVEPGYYSPDTKSLFACVKGTLCPGGSIEQTLCPIGYICPDPTMERKYYNLKVLGALLLAFLMPVFLTLLLSLYL